MEIGQEYKVMSVVTEENTAVTVGSGEVPVLATPMMIAAMESAAALCIKGDLAEGQTSVGTMIQTTHVSATPVGMRFEAVARITAVEGKRIDFAVSASDETGLIGEGTHSRVIVNTESFLKRAKRKLEPSKE